jgi:hypothetical protein
MLECVRLVLGQQEIEKRNMANWASPRRNNAWLCGRQSARWKNRALHRAVHSRAQLHLRGQLKFKLTAAVENILSVFKARDTRVSASPGRAIMQECGALYNVTEGTQ